MEDEIKKACEILKKGGIILYPTDTVWGIGCDATNENAVRRIYEIKKRPDSKTMLVLLGSSEELAYYVNEVPDIAFDLIRLSDKPLTIIYPGIQNVAPGLVASDGTLGIRITNEAFSKKLCQKFKRPIVSTSANVSGRPSPGNYAQIEEEIVRAVDYVVDYRKEERQTAKPSGIIQVGRGGLIKIIRE
jgi:L-threonylcarbamoyladenylate synthase